MTAPRPPHIQHCTSEPYRFFGREAEVAVLDRALSGGEPSVAALIGPGGQGKTAVVQHFLGTLVGTRQPVDGLFLWSFYRGKDADVCLRELYAYAVRSDRPGEVSASYAVDHVLPVLRGERWAVIFDGVEVVQYESGPWFGRVIHPELARLLEELASAPLPGVVVVTSRFPLPELERRHHFRLLPLGGLDPASARDLLRSVGVRGDDGALDRAAAVAGSHAKAVELLGTYLTRFHGGDADAHRALPESRPMEGASDEEQKVARVLSAFEAALPRETQDLLALTTAYREPPAEDRLLGYLASPPVQALLHQTWKREYQPFSERPAGWLAARVDDLVGLRLLERVGGGVAAERSGAGPTVIDAHPLVRRTFEHSLGTAGRRESARARAGFLRGRPDRRRAATLDDAREEVELFHAFCDAGLWAEADGALVALENPKHRLLVPALERDLLLRFFPAGDPARPPLWPGFGRSRSLAIAFELLGDFDAALSAYSEADVALRGDALIALGRLVPITERVQVDSAWQPLWNAYRTHALCLAGREGEALALARRLVPVDVYEWVHVFECLLRTDQLRLLDVRSVLDRPRAAVDNRWAELARLRMKTDWERRTRPDAAGLGPVYSALIEEYDRAGLPFERALTRLSAAALALAEQRDADARTLIAETLRLCRQYRMIILEADALGLEERWSGQSDSRQAVLRSAAGFLGPTRP